MGLKDLQSHITQNIGNTVESVELLRLAARGKHGKGEPLKLLIDGECCLDRLYGGYFPDWICGGQWNKMEQFLRNFSTVVLNSNLELVVCFNGALEKERLDAEWKQRQEETCKFIEEINKHVNGKKKPPPKIWWVPPAFLRSAVRATFRALQVRVMCTLDDHHKEVVGFCQKNGFHGLVADDPEYLVFDVPRYFSAQKLKLTFKGGLETVELKMKKVYEDLDVKRERFHVFAALFGGNFLLKDDEDLSGFYSALGVDPLSKTSMIEKIAEFTRGIESMEVEKVIEEVKKVWPEGEEKVARCLKYYADLKEKDKRETNKETNKDKKKEKKEKKPKGEIPSDSQKLEEEDKSKVFEEEKINDLSLNLNGDGGSGSDSGCGHEEPKEKEEEKVGETEPAEPKKETKVKDQEQKQGTSKSAPFNWNKLLYRVSPDVENVCITRHKNGLMSPYIYQILKNREIKLPAIIHQTQKQNRQQQQQQEGPSTTSNKEGQHQQNQTQSNGNGQQPLPRAHEFFRPLRQRVYAILFNMHHLQFMAKQKEEKVPPIKVKEAYYCPNTKGVVETEVQAVEVGWGVPTVEKLWLGDQEDCKRKRTRAFLSIMRSDKPIVLDNTFVPQQMLVLTCVLRYILSEGKKVLRKTELEAFLAQAFIQEMTDPTIAQDIEMSNLTMRGVHLSHLFMEGVEMALLANDACGAPVPFMLFSPWMYFNGKVFNYVLEQQSQGKTLQEICGYKMDLVFNIDQLRLAVTEGVKLQFAPGVSVPPLFITSNGPILHNQYTTTRVPTSWNPHNLPQQLANQAAAVSVPRNRVLLTAGMQSQCPVAFGGNGGLLGNYGVQRAGVGVPIYRDIPVARGRMGGVGVGGIGMSIGGASYSGSGPLHHHHQYSSGNPLAAAGRVPRIPMGGAAYLNPNVQMTNALFDQMRISSGQGNKPGFRQQGTNWQNKKGFGKGQRKFSTNKKEGSNPKTGGPSGANSSSKSSESKRLEKGAGDASDTLVPSNKDTPVNGESDKNGSSRSNVGNSNADANTIEG